MTQTLLLGVGGAVGVAYRFALERVLGARPASAELAINAFGPSILVSAVQLGLAPSLAAPSRSALTMGALGGFMLLATFNSEMIGLMQEGPRARCLAIIATAAIGCVVAGALGLGIARITA